MITLRTITPGTLLLTPGPNLDRQGLARRDFDLERLERPGTRALVDLRDIVSLTADGLAWLVEARLTVERGGGLLLLVGPSAAARAALEQAGVLRYFRQVPDLDAGAAALQDVSPTVTRFRFGR